MTNESESSILPVVCCHEFVAEIHLYFILRFNKLLPGRQALLKAQTEGGRQSFVYNYIKQLSCTSQPLPGDFLSATTTIELAVFFIFLETEHGKHSVLKN